jgi:membrane-associated phospholipid phosphatase
VAGAPAVDGHRTGPYRRLLSFLAKRFTPGGALGLSLTLTVAAIVMGASAFAELTDNVLDREGLAGHDSAVTGWLVAHRTPELTVAMRIATNLGGLWFALPLVAVAALALPRGWGRWRTVALMVGVMAGTHLLVNGVKLLIARPRPVLDEIVATATGYAFPSGHSAQALAAYCALAYLLNPRLRRRLTRVALWTGAALVVAVVGFSRLYLGVHWLTDVLGGYVIGAIWTAALLTTVSVVPEQRRRSRDPTDESVSSSGPAAAAG